MRRRPVPIQATTVFFVMLFLIAPGGILQGQNLLVWMLGGLLAILGVALLLPTLAVRSLEVRRLEVDHGAVGEPLVIRYEIRNRARFLPVFHLWVAEVGGPGVLWRRLLPPARTWIMHVGPGETVHGETVLWPMARGEARLAVIEVVTAFPFGFLPRRRRWHQDRTVPIYPRLHALRHGVLRATAPAGLLGQRVSSRPGPGDDYYGTRELRPGDRYRDIAWRATAHRDEMVCIERSRPDPPRVLVVLDCSTPTASLQVADGEPLGPRELEERGISLAASILHSANRAGYEVGLSVLGFDVPHAGLRRGTWHLARLMTQLAALDLDEARTPRHDRPPSETRHASCVVVRPDRVVPIESLPWAWYLTARQLDRLAGGTVAGSGEGVAA